MLDMASVVEDSSTRTPLIFVLSPGVVSLFSETKLLFLCDFLALRYENIVNILRLFVIEILD